MVTDKLTLEVNTGQADLDELFLTFTLQLFVSYLVDSLVLVLEEGEKGKGKEVKLKCLLLRED